MKLSPQKRGWRTRRRNLKLYPSVVAECAASIVTATTLELPPFGAKLKEAIKGRKR